MSKIRSADIVLGRSSCLGSTGHITGIIIGVRVVTPWMGVGDLSALLSCLDLRLGQPVANISGS